MYIPAHFEEKDRQKALSYVREHSFALLITGPESVASHIALLLQKKANGEYVLLGHVGTANPQSSALTDGSRALCVFHGPHAYVPVMAFASPEIPTWNYRAVHIYGTIKTLSGDNARDALIAMVQHYEMNQELPDAYKQIAPEKITAYLSSVHVFEVMVEEIQAQARLSQDQDDANYKKITNHLKQNDDVNALLLAFDMEHIRKGK
jgi:transcriptional regulator